MNCRLSLLKNQGQQDLKTKQIKPNKSKLQLQEKNLFSDVFRLIDVLSAHLLPHKKIIRCKLTPLYHLERIDKNTYRSLGNDPQFLIDNARHIFPGWYKVKSSIEFVNEDTSVGIKNGLQTFYFDTESDFQEQNAQSIPLCNAELSIVFIPPNLKQIRFNPMESICEFKMKQLVFKRSILLSFKKKLSIHIINFENKHLSYINTPPDASPGYRIAKIISSKLPYRIKSLLKRYFYRTIHVTYKEWIQLYDILTNKDKASIKNHIKTFGLTPLISIIMPTYDTNSNMLITTIESVRNQLYDNWELCIADDASNKSYIRRILNEYAKKDGRVKVVFRKSNGYISEASNSALKLASGDFIALLGHEDALSEDALYHIALESNNHPEAAIIYSDEDKISKEGNRIDPYFKCDFSYDLFLSQNMISHFGVYKADIVRKIGGFRKGFEGSQDWDLALRVLEYAGKKHIYHIPKILCHWRLGDQSTALNISAKPYAIDACLKAVQEHLDKTSPDAKVLPHPDNMLPFFKIEWPLKKQPLVSIIIPTKNKVKILKPCIESILQKTVYPDYEIIIVDNGSDDRATVKYLSYLKKQKNIKVVRHPIPFNYSALNNYAAKIANGEIFILLNNDTEVITPKWIDEITRNLLRKEIGAVGCKLLYGDNTVQHAGVVIGMGGVAGHVPHHISGEDPSYFSWAKLHRNVSAVTGACMGIKSSVFKEVGGLDENLAVVFNDTDLCLKILQKGYKIIYTPFAELYHYESKTRGLNMTIEKKAIFEKESEYFKNKWQDIIKNDSYYNPNLTLNYADFSLAFPPRRKKPWEKFNDIAMQNAKNTKYDKRDVG